MKVETTTPMLTCSATFAFRCLANECHVSISVMSAYHFISQRRTNTPDCSAPTFHTNKPSSIYPPLHLQSHFMSHFTPSQPPGRERERPKPTIASRSHARQTAVASPYSVRPASLLAPSIPLSLKLCAHLRRGTVEKNLLRLTSLRTILPPGVVIKYPQICRDKISP